MVPDFLCVAKGLTGGYLPLAATLTIDPVYRAFLGRSEENRTFFHGHTYTGNPLGAAVALASLERMESRGVLAGVAERAALLRRHLDRIAELPCVGDVRQKGLMAGIELVADRPTKQPFPPAARTASTAVMAEPPVVVTSSRMTTFLPRSFAPPSISFLVP